MHRFFKNRRKTLVVNTPSKKRRIVDGVRKRSVRKGGSVIRRPAKTEPLPETNINDLRRRQFLKALGIAGIGVAGATLAGRKAEALVMGSTPSASVVGLKDSSNTRIDPATETTLAKIPGLGIALHDYISLATDTLTDTYTFKTGGAGGSTVATLTITYTDATKATISTVAKT